MLRAVGETLVNSICLLVLSASIAAGVVGQSSPSELRGKVADENGNPVARVEVVAHWGANGSTSTYSNAVGEFQIASINSEKVALILSKPGYFRFENASLELKPGVNDFNFTLTHETALQQKVEVYSESSQIDPNTTSHQSTLVQHEVLDTPVPASHDLQQSLITIPNVLADTSGNIHVAGARQGQTEILLDGFEINDPANGSFTPRLNVDAVQSTTVENGGYGAQYAHAGAGVLSLDTLTGDDKWRFGVTNFIPGANIERGFHFGTWFPRVTFSGPIKKGRAWFSLASSAQHTYNVINGLPIGQDVSTEWAGDNLLRAQVNITPRNILQGSFLYNQSSDPQFGLGPFSPVSTTTNRQARRYFVSVKDQIWVGRTLVEFGFAVDTGRTVITPQGNSPYIITPSSSSGNYFQSASQEPKRIQIIGNVVTDSLKWIGTHTLSEGWNGAGVFFSQQSVRNEIQYDRVNGTLSERATFSGPASLRLSNTQIGGYAQDLWRPVKPVVISLGLRLDWDRLIQRVLVQPRMAVNFVPGGEGRTKFTLAWGEHYQPLSLTVIGQVFDQQRTSIFYDSTGMIPLGAPIVSAFLMPHRGLYQPRSYNTTAEWDQKLRKNTFVGAAYLLRQGKDGLSWELQPSGSFLLQNNRSDYFESGEVWVRHQFSDKAEFLLDYTHQIARSNEVLDPTLFSTILSPQQSGPLLWDSPDRVISRGWTPLPRFPIWHWQFLASYFFEYHSGFPYTAVNDQRQLVGPANSRHFPEYVSLNIGLEKQFTFDKHEWAIRFSSNNIMNHDNPDVVVNNIDAPNFGTFSGGHGRSYTIRIRLVTAH
jgi:hypothetical protein